MKGSVIPTYSGLPTILKRTGLPHHDVLYDLRIPIRQYECFFVPMAFDEIFFSGKLPVRKVVNGFGVQDDFLYDYALNHLKNSPLRLVRFCCLTFYQQPSSLRDSVLFPA